MEKLVSFLGTNGRTTWINPKQIVSIWVDDRGGLNIWDGGTVHGHNGRDLKSFCEYLRTEPGIVISNG